MSHLVRYDAEAGLIILSIQGTIDSSTIRKVVSEVIRISEEHKCLLILSDLRDATAGLSTVDIYNLPRMLSKMLSVEGLQIHNFRRAVVVAADMDDFSFFETTSVNRAQNVKVFRDMDEAKKWLSGK